MTAEMPEWIASAEDWIRAAVQAHGWQLTGPPVPVRCWSLSCVLRVPTNAGNVYFKASARYPFFANEALLLPYLATHVGTAVPSVLASDPEARWMLLKDIGPPLDAQVPLDQKLAIVSSIAMMQRATFDHADQLRRLGVVDRRPDLLAVRLGDVIESALAIAPQTSYQHAVLRQYVDHMANLCLAIGASAIPQTLIHGDLHTNNMTYHGGKLYVYDWAEACLTHPFVDMFTIYNEEDRSRRSALRDAYLSRWRDFESWDRLQETWAISGVVHALHHLESYVSILQHTESRFRDELRGAIPFLLGKTQRYLQELNQIDR